jgi:outer membrane protein assembly factor BamB
LKLRIWPGIAAAALIVVGLVIGLSVTATMPDTAAVGNLAALIGTLAVVVWWLFFSRARWSERLGAMALMIAMWFAMRPFLDRSIIGGGMGALPFFAFTVLAAALAVWASATQDLSNGIRRVSLFAAFLIACVLCTLVKTAGVRGGGFEFHWRWTPTPEEQLLAKEEVDPAPIPAAPSIEIPDAPALKATADSDTAPTPPRPRPRKPAEWPGFRGTHRDGVVHNLRIETDWAKSPPEELWRRPIGPGWSSFAVDGDLFYTQEQRGEDEIVACYRLSTGEPVWRHRDPVRFW